MKKILIALILLAFMMALPSVAAQEYCSAPGGGCPATCVSAGVTCSPKSQSIPAPNVPGKELTCIKQKNVGCGFFLEFPPVRGNDCPSDMTHDDAIDGATDCGFLGLGAILGDGKSVCHQTVDVACKVNNKCPAGTKPKAIAEKSCFVSTGQSTNQLLQCCTTSAISNAPIEIDEPIENAQDVLDARNEFATTVQIIDEAEKVILTPGQTFTFTFFAKKDNGEIVTNKTTVKWSLVGNSDAYADSAINADTGELTVGENAHDQFRVKLTQIGGYEKTDFANVTIVNFHDFKIDPPTLQAEVGARILFSAKALQAINNNVLDIPSLWGVEGNALITTPNQGISQTYAVALINAGAEGSNANITAHAGTFDAKSQIRVTGFLQQRVPMQIVLDAGDTDMTVGSQKTLGVLILSTEGIALASSRATFTTSNLNVATVTNQRANVEPGVITAVGAGDVTITVSAGVGAARVSQSVDLHITECEDESTDEAFCQARVNFDVVGPHHQTCVQGIWDNNCTANVCTGESNFQCVVNNAPGRFTCNLDNSHFENCIAVELDTPNAAVDANSLDGAICGVSLLANVRLENPSLRDRIAQLASNPASVAQVEFCKLLGVYSNARECITQPRDTVLSFHFGPDGSSSSSFEIGHWRYEIQDASTGDANLVAISKTNTATGEVIAGVFQGEGAEVGIADPSTHVTIRSIESTLDEDSSVDSLVTFRVTYNSCRYDGVFPDAQ